MDSKKVDMFIATMSTKFPNTKIMVIKERLERLDDSKFTVVQSMDYKDPTTLLIISIFLGALGVDRFMLGEIGLGVLKLLTLGGCGIWTIIDWFTVMNRTKEKNFQVFLSVA